MSTKKRSILLSTLFALVLIFTIATFASMNQGITVSAYSNSQNSTIFAKADFSDDTVLVVMTNEETLRFNKYTNLDFPEIELREVIDLTEATENLLREQIDYDSNQIVDKTKFKSILSLKLKESGREYVLKAIEKLSNRKDIYSVEPDYILTSDATSPTPNDRYYNYQMNWLGNDNGIKVPDAWNVTCGSGAVRVGVIDSGIDSSHPDLINQVNNSLSRDFTIEAPYISNDVVDLYGHGTHVAGIIGAEGNNLIGISGVAQEVEIVSLRITTYGRDSHLSFASRLVLAINYANSAGIKVLNNSNGVANFGGSIASSNAVREAIDSYNGLFVTAAGNLGTNIDETLYFPAMFQLPNMITVGALNVDSTDKASFSNFGEKSVDVYAPGEMILSTYPKGKGANFSLSSDYELMSGTSMSTPFVSGVAALILSINPRLSGSELKSLILNNADSITLTIPVGETGTVLQTTKKLNAFRVISSVFFNIDDGGSRIIGTKHKLGKKLVVPDNINGNIIDKIGPNAFSDSIEIEKIVLPNTIEIIEQNAFGNCKNVEMVEADNSIKKIHNRAFAGCSKLTVIEKLNNLEEIGEETFDGCISLIGLYSTPNLKIIGERAFYNCKSLERIPLSLCSLDIKDGAFVGCVSLENLTMIGPIKSIGAGAFLGLKNLKKIGSLNDLETIGADAFNGCTNLAIVESLGKLKVIGKGAFYDCTSLIISSALSELEIVEDEAFYGCINLSGLNCANKLREIGDRAFYGCAAFSAINGDPKIRIIGNAAFYNCTNLSFISNLGKVKTIGAKAFEGCALLQVDSGLENVNDIGEEAFFGCTSLVVDNLHAASIGARAFMNCTSITALAFPDAVSIGQEAFKGCTGLTSLCFARGNTPVSASIGARAFENCTNINEVVCDSFNVPTLGENCFPNNCGFTLLVPYNKSGEYTNIFAAYTSSVGYTTVRITLVCGGTESTKDVYYGQALGLSSFRKDGYLFRGWFGTADYKGQKRSLNEICTTKENFTLYGRLVSRSDIENYIAKLGTLADYYVQNGYESINSNTFSISDIAEYYRQRGSIYAGGELYKNIEVQEILTNVSHPYNIVVGNVGTSVREELEFIREHLSVCENIYVTGLSLGTFLNSLGYELNNYADDALLDMAREIYNMSEARGSHIIFPTMFYAVSADYRTTAGLKSLDDIGANEAALFGIFPEMSTTGTLAVYGYSGFFTVEEYSVMSDEVKAEYENAARAFVTEIESSKYNNVNKLFFGDTLRLCNENKYSFVSEKGRAPSLQNAIFQHLMVGGETINNITEIFRANPRAGERMLMRVECNIGYTDNRMDMDKFSKAIAKCLPDIRWALESGCKVILMASNKVDKDDASDWQAKEFNNGRFLSEFSQAVGVEARFVSVDNIYDVLSDNCSVYWISNLYPYEKYYAFPSA